jgi:predicted nuclease of restriction endonuclease-like (RecB) superfamily
LQVGRWNLDGRRQRILVSPECALLLVPARILDTFRSKQKKGLMQLGAGEAAERGRLMARKKKETAVTPAGLPRDYTEFLESLKARVRQAQTQAMLSVNRELIQLYWDIGRQIVQQQERDGWGRAVVERLADDIQKSFPGMGGFSRTNVFRMRAFYLAYRSAIVPQAVGQKQASRKVAQPVGQLGPPDSIANLPWGHNVLLVERVKDQAQRLWYTAKTLEHGWSRAILTLQIESDLYHRQGKAITNFAQTLPAPQSDLAQQALKDPYLFDFLTLHAEAIERDLEDGLLDHIQKFLVELGTGFAFVGRQVPLSVTDDDDYLDLLFYHLKLRCFVVIDLKMKKFSPADAGQMNYYLSAVDSLMKHPTDGASMGLILCRFRDRIKAEYALRDIAKPIGVAEWQTKLVQSLPEPLRGSLPSIEEIEAELSREGS